MFAGRAKRLGPLFDDDFDSREVFPPLIVIAIVDTDQLLTITFDNFFVPF
jgi:hypothetical protein